MTDSIARPTLRALDHGVATLHDVMVTMRDGIRLATDIYLPTDNGNLLPGPWSVVIERTPYDKLRSQTNTPDGPFWAESMQRHGDSCCEWHFHLANGGAEVGIAPPERTLERAVQDGRTDVGSGAN
jgi:predicted acyl esterase